jgi:hypothetical protein
MDLLGLAQNHCTGTGHAYGSETKGAKNGVYFVIPVAWAPTEAIQMFEKKPVFVLGCI